MQHREAAELIDKYAAVVGRGAEESGIARKLSQLPASIGKIRLAFYIFFRDTIAQEALTQALQDQFLLLYMGLNHFIADRDADKINEFAFRVKREGNQALSESEKALFSQFMTRFAGLNERLEIQSYINECLGERDNQDFILLEGL